MWIDTPTAICAGAAEGIAKLATTTTKSKAANFVSRIMMKFPFTPLHRILCA
jgi:hypothetical protein